MSGPLALHGGGEFLSGDEPFLRAILERAPAATGTVRVAVVPTAAARGRPDLAAANGVAAFGRVAAEAGIRIEASVVPIVDVASAADPDLAGRLEASDLIHLPGGDPDLIPTLLPATATWAAIVRAVERGALLAGASAGAMALGSMTWTPGGLVPGLALVPGVVVAPHADAASWAHVIGRFGGLVAGDLGILGLAERTGIIGRPGSPWQVVGEGAVRWLPPGSRAAASATVATAGHRIELA